MEKGTLGVKKGLALALGGVVIGAINGLLGGGGGMLTVPMLTKIGKLDTKRAHATAISVMLPLSIASGVTYTLSGYHHLGYGIMGSLAVTLGGLFGAVLLNRLPKAWVSLLFYGLMTAAGVRMIVG